MLQLKRSHRSQLKDPTCRNEDRRSHVPQLRPGAVYGVAQSRTRLKRLSSSSSSNQINVKKKIRIPVLWILTEDMRFLIREKGQFLTAMMGIQSSQNE